MNTLIHDLKFALRTLRKSFGFTAIAVITLALGIGANTAMFSVIEAIVLRPLPYREPSRLMRVDETDPHGEWAKSGVALKGVSPPDFLEFQERSRAFEQLAAWDNGSVVLTAGKEPQRLHSVSATSNLFSVLGVRPALGRDFVAEDARPDRNNVVILSHWLWQQVFGGSPDVIDRTITLDGKSFTVAGVMPPAFTFPVEQAEVALWTPMAVEHNEKLRGANYLDVVGRLKASATPGQAKADLDVIASHPEAQLHWVTDVTPLKESVTTNVQSPLWILAAAVGFVLLIAAANVASLCLSRAAARQKEIAVRLAIGATRMRLIRQLLTESVVLSLIGGACGLLVALWGTQVLVASAPRALPRVGDVGFDAAVLGFTFATSLISGIAFGLAPALKSSHVNINQVIKQGTAGTRLGHQPLHAVLVVAEVALAAVLLCGAGLMVRTLINLHAVDPGFDANSVLTAEVLLPQSRYPEAAQQRDFLDQSLARIRALPQVESAAATTNLPMSGTGMVFQLRLTNPGQPPVSIIAVFRAATPDYFRTLRTSLVRGRFFNDSDTANSLPVGIINESLARSLWPNEDPIGKRFPAAVYVKAAPYIVGVVRDVHQTGLDSAPRPELVAPYSQAPQSWMRFVVRTSSDPAAIAPILREQIHSVDANVSLDAVRTLDSLLATSVAERRFYMVLLIVFATLALGIAAVGVFGVVSYAVAQRTHEIGVRMALGATPGNVLRLMVARGFVASLVGVAVGIVGAIASTRVMTRLLFGVRPTDFVTYIALVVLLAAVSLLASYIPARRATKVDPMVALRYE